MATVLSTLLLATASVQAVVLNDDSVLLRLSPAQTQLHNLVRGRERERQQTQNTESKNTLSNNERWQAARSALALARSSGDTRYVEQAVTLMNLGASGLSEKTSTLAFDELFLRADIAQFRHDFAAAEQLLDALIARDPLLGSAHIMRANIAFTQGHYAQGQRHCQALIGSSSTLAYGCIAYARSLQGQLASSYVVLQNVLRQTLSSPLNKAGVNRAEHSAQNGEQYVAQSATQDPELSYLLQLAADMADRNGLPVAAIAHLRAALQFDPGNVPAQAALADLLLAQKDFRALASLFKKRPDNDVLLLRWLYGQRLQERPQLSAEQALLQRMARSRRRGDSGHEREQALALWWLQGDANAAYAFAQRNLEHQKETVDWRLLQSVAQADNKAKALMQTRAWQQKTHYEDAGLVP